MRSWRGIVLALASSGLVLAAAVPAVHAVCGSTQRFAAKKDVGPGRAPLAIGDSVLLGAAEETSAIGYDVDVRTCRPTDEGLDVLRARKRKGRLPRLTVIALGANSAVTTRDVRTALRIVGPDRVLGLVTPREVPGMSTGDAKVMRAAAKRWPERIALVDWVKYAKRRPRLTYGDGIHLTPAGQRAMTKLLERELPLATPPAPPPPDDEPGSGGGGVQAP